MNDEIWRTAKFYKKKSGTLQTIKELEVSNLGRVRYAENKKSISPVKTKGVYPHVQPYLNKKQTPLALHVLVASTFIELPKDKNCRIIDHIDRNPDNCMASNLRFTSPSINNMNRNKFYQNKVFLETVDGKIVNMYDASKLTREDRHELNAKMYSTKKGLRSTWHLFTTETWNKLLNTYNSQEGVINKLETGLVWKPVVDNYLISDIGLVKKQIKDNKFFYTFGRTNSSGYSYLPKFYKSLGTGLIHRVVASVFLNNGVLLTNDQLVDHINTIRGDNSVGNLRICNGMAENLANETTKRKISIPVRFINSRNNKIVYFCSRRDCIKRLDSRNVENWISKGRISSYPDIIVEYISKEELDKYRKFEISFEYLDINNFDDMLVELEYSIANN